MRIHFIGICGVAMSALAIAFQKAGYEVTGSDVGFFPPISTELEKQGIHFYPGWHPDRVLRSFDEGGENDHLVIVGNVASSSNPEWLYVQEHKLNFKSYPEAIAEFFIKDHSIVCAGTFGKTSSTTLLSWILTEAGFDPSYMFGGLAINPSPIRGGEVGSSEATKDFPSAKLSNSNWSVVEGDEYKSARFDNGPKFAHYSPTHLLLTGLAWDHADVYPTEELYMDAFRKLLQSIPDNGVVVACADDKNIASIISNAKCPITHYGKTSGLDYQYSQIIETTKGISFDITHNNKTYHIESQLLGDYQAANITGCFAMACEIGIEPTTIIEAIKDFRGMKRRLQKRYDGEITVFDDIAHSPTKARATLATLRSIYEGKIIAVYEPNTGNRRAASIPGYADAFADADEVIIPRLTTVKKDPTDPEEILDGQSLTEVITKTHSDVRYIEDDTTLVNHLAANAKNGDVIIFLGSHGFRGMIEALITQKKSV